MCAALHMAAANGHLDIAKLLLDHGAVSILSFLVKLDVLQSSLSFVGSALQGRDIGMHQEMCQSLVSLHLGSCGVHYRNISSINEGSTWASCYLFPIEYVGYLSSLWISFRRQSHYVISCMFSSYPHLVVETHCKVHFRVPKLDSHRL